MFLLSKSFTLLLLLLAVNHINAQSKIVLKEQLMHKIQKLAQLISENKPSLDSLIQQMDPNSCVTDYGNIAKHLDTSFNCYCQNNFINIYYNPKKSVKHACVYIEMRRPEYENNKTLNFYDLKKMFGIYKVIATPCLSIAKKNNIPYTKETGIYTFTYINPITKNRVKITIYSSDCPKDKNVYINELVITNNI